MSTPHELASNFEAWAANFPPEKVSFLQLMLLKGILDGGGGGGGGTVEVSNFPDTQQVSGSVAVNNLPATQPVSAPVDGPLFARLSDGAEAVNLPAILGALTEAAPASDTASAGLNGRLQRIAQRLTSLLGLLPGSLGPKTAANSFPVTIASDQVLSVQMGSGISVASQTLTANGLSDPVAVAGKQSISCQLLWSGATSSQVVRLAGSFDNQATWHLLDESLAGQTFTTAEISDYATAGLQPGLLFDLNTPRLTHVRLRWVSGSATNLAVKWGLA